VQFNKNTAWDQAELRRQQSGAATEKTCGLLSAALSLRKQRGA
jgi:hypothetical protein